MNFFIRILWSKVSNTLLNSKNRATIQFLFSEFSISQSQLSQMLTIMRLGLFLLVVIKILCIWLAYILQRSSQGVNTIYSLKVVSQDCLLSYQFYWRPPRSKMRSGGLFWVSQSSRDHNLTLGFSIDLKRRTFFCFE